MTFLALPVLLAALAAPPAAPRLPLGAVLERMQKNYDQARDFRARFSQKYTTVAFGRTKVSTGEVAFRKPGLMRWDYDKPDATMFLSNGQVLWMYEPNDKQAFKQELKDSQLPAALAFIMGKGKLADEFDISFAEDARYGRPEDYRLALKPKQPQSTYKSILFVVDPQSFLVTESVLVKAQGDVNHITFSDAKVNTKIAPAHFKWSPPAGTRVIDTGKLGKN